MAFFEIENWQLLTANFYKRTDNYFLTVNLKP